MATFRSVFPHALEHAQHHHQKRGNFSLSSAERGSLPSDHAAIPFAIRNWHSVYQKAVQFGIGLRNIPCCNLYQVNCSTSMYVPLSNRRETHEAICVEAKKALHRTNDIKRKANTRKPVDTQ